MMDRKRKKGRQKKQCFDNTRKWSGMSCTLVKTQSREQQTKLCADVVANLYNKSKIEQKECQVVANHTICVPLEMSTNH